MRWNNQIKYDTGFPLLIAERCVREKKLRWRGVTLRKPA